jgi:DNA-binding LacI/PurR family transcriptional regulator
MDEKGQRAPVTLKDIAERVGKSVPTVSRALADFDDISPKTREEVQRVAREMGYEPNISARNLQKQRTDTIALIVPTANHLRFSDPFFSELLTGIVEKIAEEGFSLNISTSATGDESEMYLRHVRGRRVDGFIVVRTQRRDSRINVLRELNVPFVAFGRVEGDNDFHLVDEDDAAGIRLVVDHLVQLGHSRIAFIAEPTTFTKPYHRMQGYQEGLRAHGLPFDPDLVFRSKFRQRSGREGARRLLAMENPPTAIIASNDLMALGAISEARDMGLVVGRDVSITGFDDILLAEYANPALTTVHQPALQLGAAVAEMLLKVIKQEPVAQKQIVLQPRLVVRQSTGPRRERRR